MKTSARISPLGFDRRPWTRRASLRAAAGGLGLLTLLAAAVPAQQGTIGNFPFVAYPPENPSSPEKVELGRALFFEEQLSADNTMACATCHLPEAGGADPRAGALEPGLDRVPGTDDDIFGSPGMIDQGPTGEYTPHPFYGVAPQVTNRNAPSVIGAAFFRSLLWEQQMGPVFRDEQGNVVLSDNAALESQAVGPPLSPVEMGHEAIDWAEITAKLAAVRPLALASDLPPALAGFIGDSPGYGPLFARAFGTPEITRERIAMAIATYERTLVPDRTPFDTGTLSLEEAAGLVVFSTRGDCADCHSLANRIFSDGQSHNLQLVGNERAVKTPSLRNVGLRRRFVHTGVFSSLDQILTTNLGIHILFLPSLTGIELRELKAFLATGLTDPRVAARQPPFDRPTLRSERESLGANLYGAGTPGSDGLVPQLIANCPPNLGHQGFKIGVGGALGGARAILALSRGASEYVYRGITVYVDGREASVVARLLSGTGPGRGVATFAQPLPSDPALIGQERFAQWFVLDPGASGGIASSAAARFQIF